MWRKISRGFNKFDIFIYLFAFKRIISINWMSRWRDVRQKEFKESSGTENYSTAKNVLLIAPHSEMRIIVISELHYFIISAKTNLRAILLS